MDELGRHETALERTDRNLVELLQELRVAQTGVQVLFAFLLTLPFTARFEVLTRVQELIYFGTLLASGGAAVLLIAPTSWHRIVFRHGDKEHLVTVSNRFAVAGLACVAVSITGVVLLVSDVLFGTLAAALTAIVAGGLCTLTWYVLPLRRRRAHGDGGAAAEASRPSGPRQAGAARRARPSSRLRP